ncbi:hypothetical protein AURDEDRAFT_131261, partial [Auricularia subglabra TFB-10046 SS5]
MSFLTTKGSFLSILYMVEVSNAGSLILCSGEAGLNTLIRDLWDFDRLPRDPASRADCEAWQAVPLNVAGLADWLLVVPRKQRFDKTRPFQVIHVPTEDDNVKYELALRVQGLVHQCDLNPVGNWDGTALGAQNAVQRLVLHGRGFDHQWSATLRQLNNIITVVTRLVNPRHDVYLFPEAVSTVLPLQRRVFNRTRAGFSDVKPTSLDPTIRPAHVRTIQSMGSQWTLGPPILTGVVRDGEVRRANHVIVRPGNFVDAMVTVEIVCKPRGTRVFFKLDRVVQVDAAEELVPGLQTGSNDDDDDVVAADAENVFAAENTETAEAAACFVTMTSLAGAPGKVDYSSLPDLEFEIDYKVVDGIQVWCMTFSDAEWAQRSFVPRPPAPCPPTKFIIDEAPIVYEDEIRAFPHFPTTLDLVDFISQSASRHEVDIGCTILMRGLQAHAAVFVDSFRELQGVLLLCDGFISGSFLVAFLLDKNWDNLDMSLFIPLSIDSYSLKKVALSFFKQKGYALVKEGDSHAELAETYVRRVLKLQHAHTLRCVEIVEITAPNATRLLQDFHSSLMSNALTARHLLVMYHQWTAGSQSLAPTTLAPAIRDKYERQGVQFIMGNTDWNTPCGSRCPALLRGVHREGTSTLIPLSSTWNGLPPKEFPLLELWRSPVPCTNIHCQNCLFMYTKKLFSHPEGNSEISTTIHAHDALRHDMFGLYNDASPHQAGSHVRTHNEGRLNDALHGYVREYSCVAGFHGDGPGDGPRLLFDNESFGARMQISPHVSPGNLILPPEEVFSMIAAYCAFHDLAILACICKPATWAVYNDRRRRVNILVSPFVGNQLAEFHALLHDNRGAITGSVPVRLFADHIPFIPADLDIAVPIGMSAIAIITFFKNLGYKLVPRGGNQHRERIHAGLYPDTEWRIREISTFIRAQDSRRVEIIRCETAYAVDAILAHPNTLLQNFITGTMIGCFHASLTMHGHALACNPTTPDRVMAEQLLKYKRRGFQLHADNSYLETPCGARCPTMRRKVDDAAMCLLRYTRDPGDDAIRRMPPSPCVEELLEMRPGQSVRASCRCANPYCERRTERPRRKHNERDSFVVTTCSIMCTLHGADGVRVTDGRHKLRVARQTWFTSCAPHTSDSSSSGTRKRHDEEVDVKCARLHQSITRWRATKSGTTTAEEAVVDITSDSSLDIVAGSASSTAPDAGNRTTRHSPARVGIVTQRFPVYHSLLGAPVDRRGGATARSDMVQAEWVRSGDQNTRWIRPVGVKPRSLLSSAFTPLTSTNLSPGSGKWLPGSIQQIGVLCDCRDLAKLSCTCLELAYIAYVERYKRVKRCVEPYFPDYDAFMSLLSETGSVLTGSLVLYILLARETIRYRSLSIVVAQSKFEVTPSPDTGQQRNSPAENPFQIVTKYLLDVQYSPYADAGRRALHSSLFPAGKTQIESTHTFMRTMHARVFSVDIIQSRTEYAADAVQSHPSSLMHNFVSATDIVCLYPWFTFTNASMATRDETPSRLVAVQLAKYKTWGMELYADNRDRLRECCHHCPLARHDFSDTRVCVQRYSDFTMLDEIYQRNRLPPRTLRDLYMEVEPTQQFRVVSNSEYEMVPANLVLLPSKTSSTHRSLIYRTTYTGRAALQALRYMPTLLNARREQCVRRAALAHGRIRRAVTMFHASSGQFPDHKSGASGNSTVAKDTSTDQLVDDVAEDAAEDGTTDLKEGNAQDVDDDARSNASGHSAHSLALRNAEVVDTDTKDKPAKVKAKLVQAKLQK